MKETARIVCPTGAVVLPMATPYDCQLLFEYVSQSAKRFGGVSFDVNRRHWRVMVQEADGGRCHACQRPPEALTFILGRQVWCARCAYRAVGGGPEVIGFGPRKPPRRKERHDTTNGPPERRVRA
jgi:hypothetical protein